MLKVLLKELSSSATSFAMPLTAQQTLDIIKTM
jgi:hypothetical protein